MISVKTHACNSKNTDIEKIFFYFIFASGNKLLLCITIQYMRAIWNYVLKSKNDQMAPHSLYFITYLRGLPMGIIIKYIYETIRSIIIYSIGIWCGCACLRTEKFLSIT